MVQRVEAGQLWYYPETTLEVLHVEKQIKCLVRFVETGETVYARAECIRDRRVRSNLTPKVKGVGYIGCGKYNINNSKVIYQTWVDMIGRCYANKGGPTYNDVTVHNSWHNFQNFAEYYHSKIIAEEGIKFHLDKDLERSKVYSEDTVHLIPESINTLLTSEGQHRTGYLGVSFHKGTGKFCASCRGKWLGVFDNELEAHLVYRDFLEGQYRLEAEKYKHVLSERAYFLLKTRKLHEGKLIYKEKVIEEKL